jgi:hypothetical protein
MEGPQVGQVAGTAPPQKPTSTAHCRRRPSCFTSSAATSRVGGRLFSGMSRIVVTRRPRRRRVAVANPSHSVRPGSFTCTCVSTSRAAAPRPRPARGGQRR